MLAVSCYSMNTIGSMSANSEISPDSPRSSELVSAAESYIIDDAADIYDEVSRYSHITGATTDPVKDYLKLIGKVPLLNAEQEVDLAKRIEAGLYATYVLKGWSESSSSDKSAIGPVIDEEPVALEELNWLEEDGSNANTQLMEANLRLVVSIAKRYTGRGMQFLDIIQEGNLGLVRAVEKFDYTKGYKFSTYATWWIRQSITRGMANQSRTIRVPVHMSEVIIRVARIERELEQKLDREATPGEIAKELDMTPDKVIEVQAYGRAPVSIHTLLGEGGSAEFGDLIEDTSAIVPAEAAEYGEMRRVLEDVLTSFFNEREAGILNMRYGLQDGKPKTLDEIGKVYGVTRERIRQIESQAMTRLRKSEHKEVLRDFLD